MHVTRPAVLLGSALTLTLFLAPLAGEQTPNADDSKYLLPPDTIVRMIDAPPIPTAIVSPSKTTIAVVERSAMPTIAELSRPMLRLAGARVNPRSNGPHRMPGNRAISITGTANGATAKVTVPPQPNLAAIRYSPDGTKLAFTQATDKGTELWIADVATGRARAIASATLNATLGDPCEWFDDSRLLACRFVKADRGAAPAESDVPAGPNVQENQGKPAPVHTYEDLLTSAHDEALFDYYFTSQIAIVDATSGERTPIGTPAIYDEIRLSPDGRYLLVERIHRPYSWLVPSDDFPRAIEVMDRRGDIVKTIGDLPLGDNVPNNGVRTGPRAVAWKPSDGATLAWAEALDGGNPRVKAEFRDRVLAMSAPFAGDPAELAKTEYRFQRLSWTDKGVGLLREFDRAKRWTRTWILEKGEAPRKLWDLSAEDRYKDPGTPLGKPSGYSASRGFGDAGPRTVLQVGSTIFTTGDGASPEGDRPFLDRVDLKTLATDRLFRSDNTSYETVVALLDDNGASILTRHETPTDPPNYFVRKVGATTAPTALTAFADPTPQLRGVTKQLITYARSDGVKLSGTLYLPPAYKKGERLPLVMWAYPREFTDPGAASQVVGSPNRFTTISPGNTHMYLLFQGYAVLDGPTMPIVGPGETANDTYVEQLVASAKAAIDAAVDMGVADRDRVGVGGHSYGAFMTANLLAHSRLFRAGFAESGAYNRTLTPFGFQNESRTFWEVPDLYAKMSPFWYAKDVKDPILLMHGEADDNSGTFPIQSERFYMALRGHGATVRYITLPAEAHGYAARETILDVAAEKILWFDKWVKKAAARTTNQ